MYMAKSQKQLHHIFIQQRKLQKQIYFSMHFGFNNQFIKVTRTRPIFQKKYFVLF
jgi:hypothetical protein